MPSTVWSKLQDVAMRAPVVVPPQTPLRVAAEVMDKESIGAVVVAVDNRTVGILSERDVVSALAWGADPDEVTVAAAMSHDVVSLQSDDTLYDFVLKTIQLRSYTICPCT